MSVQNFYGNPIPPMTLPKGVKCAFCEATKSLFGHFEETELKKGIYLCSPRCLYCFDNSDDFLEAQQYKSELGKYFNIIVK